MGFNQQYYDIIIGGGGCSGLSLAWHISQKDRDKNILIIGKEETPDQGKTWCYWSKDDLPSPVKPDHVWESVEIFAGKAHIREKLKKLTYNCIKSTSYHRQMTEALASMPNIDRIEADVEGYGETKQRVGVQADGKTFTSEQFFKCYGKPDTKNSRFVLKQHFKGIEIVTDKPVFDPDTARMMDFRVKQKDGATFFYVLPFSKTEALVEYTLFSPALLEDEAYDEAIAAYLKQEFGLGSDNYRCSRTEFGVIPMADRLHTQGPGKRIHFCGTASGIPKASTGYAFSRIHRQAALIAESISAGKKVTVPPSSSLRYRIYDLVMLDVLTRRKQIIVEVFEALFTKNPVERILRFMDEKSTLSEDLSVMASVPRIPFLKAVARNSDLIKGGV